MGKKRVLALLFGGFVFFSDGILVKTYTTVSTVGSSPLSGSLVDLNVLDNQVASVETLGVGVGLSVLEEIKNVLGRLDGPASLGHTKLLAYWKLLDERFE